MLYRLFLTDFFFFLYKQGKDNRERILVRRYLEIVIRLSNIGTKLVIIMNRMRKMIYDPVKHSSEQALCTIYTSDSVPLPLFRYDKHRTIHCFLS